MTSGDLNIDLTQSFFIKVVGLSSFLSIKCRLPFVATTGGIGDMKEAEKVPRPIPTLFRARPE